MNETLINPKMLTLARQTRGLLQKELAEKINVLPMVISRIENSPFKIPIDNDLLSKINKELDFETLFFTRDEDIFNPEMGYFRKRKTISTKTLNASIGYMNIYSQIVDRLLDEVDIQSLNIIEWDLELMGSASKAALSLREFWKVPKGRIDNLTDLLEKNGIFIIHHDFKSEKIDAFTIRSRRYGAPIIFVNETFPEDRRRLNVAHELAHLVLHYNQYYINEKRDIEKEAFEFASEFLVPSADFKSHIGSQKIELRRLANMKLYWKISMMALIQKAQFCKKITYNQSRYLYSQMSDFRKVEPVEIPYFETPKLLSSLVKYINTDMGVTHEDVAAPLGLKPSELKRLTGNTVFHMIPLETESDALDRQYRNIE